MEKWAMGSRPFGEKHHHGGCWDETSDDQWWLMMVTKLYKPKHPRVTNRVARTGRNTGVANLGIIVMAFQNKMICWWWFWCVYQLWFDMKSRIRMSENNDHDDGILALHDAITYLQEWEWLWEHWASRSLRCKEPETKQTFLTNCWWWGLVWWGGRISNVHDYSDDDDGEDGDDDGNLWGGVTVESVICPGYVTANCEKAESTND